MYLAEPLRSFLPFLPSCPRTEPRLQRRIATIHQESNKRAESRQPLRKGPESSAIPCFTTTKSRSGKKWRRTSGPIRTWQCHRAGWSTHRLRPALAKVPRGYGLMLGCESSDVRAFSCESSHLGRPSPALSRTGCNTVRRHRPIRWFSSTLPSPNFNMKQGNGRFQLLHPAAL